MANENMLPTADQPPITDRIATGSGLDLVVEKRLTGQQIELSLRAHTHKRCVLHWGIRRPGKIGWHPLPQLQWPQGTVAAGEQAMQTPFVRDNGESLIRMVLPSVDGSETIEFALFFPDEERWDNNGRRNYQIAMPGRAPARGSLMEQARGQFNSADELLESEFNVEGLGKFVAVAGKDEKGRRVVLLTDISGPLLLHWGIARRSPNEWLLPPKSSWPPGTVSSGENTAQTPFATTVDGLNQLEMFFPEAEAPFGIQFVLRQGAEGSWIKHHHGNFYFSVHAASPSTSQFNAAGLTELSNRIIQSETGTGSWTLMHRFNLCYDLLEQAQGNNEALALLYVWLRFSALRQLTWQRNYNTKPRELAHAQDRLTNRLAELYQSDHNGRPFIRLMLSTIGRGGDGQRIRDEILQIMHRHHLKEVTGHFLEEWHQKLHNNTTPDDIVICEAYLEFLRSNGNLESFYETLQRAGVTRERLETFERPIRTSPDFIPHLRDALIHDFENFLRVLNAVHSSTDLETAINTAKERLDQGTQNLMWQVWNRRNDSGEALVPLVEQISEARRRVSGLLHNGRQVRSLLYLDLALEQLVRVVVERNLHLHLQGEQLTGLIQRVLENVTLSYQHTELGACQRHWERLMRESRDTRMSAAWSLHAKSVVDRIGRSLGEWTDQLYQLLQPKAEFLGRSFNAENWTITLFSEEVVRGSSLGFALSMLLHQLDRVLRKSAKLGDWQIVSRGRGTGRVEVMDSLRAVQGKELKTATVVIADKVMGDEELPKEVVAVIAPDVTDLVSHVAVRARNAKVLFASCSDPGLLEQLKAHQGKFLSLEVTAAGDVVFKAAEGAESPVATAPGSRPRLVRGTPSFTRFAVTMDEFNEKIVGGKSCSQTRLRGKLPAWVKQPASVALPFGTFEKVLSIEANKQIQQRYRELANGIKAKVDPEALVRLRALTESLAAPAELKTALSDAMGKAGLPFPADWEAAWGCIKKVWASKWNERAVLSRKQVGLADADLFMAVLVQSVVEADYAFVIHTVNPSTSNSEELYAEVVLGLGETLVGNFPGRALSFVWDKPGERARVLSFPSKSVGLYGGGLIFRSDSNGEDMEGYAGAGLYDSVLLTSPRRTELDYSGEPLIWDETFRNGLLAGIAKAGLAIEKAMGSPQDVEGAVSKGEYYVVQSRPQVGLPGEATG